MKTHIFTSREGNHTRCDVILPSPQRDQRKKRGGGREAEETGKKGGEALKTMEKQTSNDYNAGKPNSSPTTTIKRKTKTKKTKNKKKKISHSKGKKKHFFIICERIAIRTNRIRKREMLLKFFLLQIIEIP